MDDFETWKARQKELGHIDENTMMLESKSSIKIEKNTKGLNYKIKLVEGTTKEEMERLRAVAIYELRELDKFATQYAGELTVKKLIEKPITENLTKQREDAIKKY